MSKRSRRANRRDRKQRTPRATGASLAILNVGTGDTKISFDKANPKERERACRIVTDMLRRGYAILVAAGEKDGKPLYFRAMDFDPETAEYIVAGMPEDEAATEAPAEAPAPRRRGRPAKRRVAAEGAPAVAVARSAGGMSTAADSVEAHNRELLQRYDNFAGLRGGLAQLAAERSEWAGIPMPMDGHPLIVEPKYPRAAALMAFGKAATEEGIKDAEDAEWSKQRKLRGRFYSTHRRADVLTWEEPDGRIEWGLHYAIHSFTTQVMTLGAQDAWGIEQEAAAVRTLAELVSHRQFKQYMLTGAFLETSARTRLTYMFRRLRPTVVIDGCGETSSIRCALCLHPIAYYQGSWAGAMCPTDDVVAHLMLMRGDEPLFWKRSNQHPAFRPEAGL